jgi:hypothetical protein
MYLIEKSMTARYRGRTDRTAAIISGRRCCSNMDTSSSVVTSATTNRQISTKFFASATEFTTIIARWDARPKSPVGAVPPSTDRCVRKKPVSQGNSSLASRSRTSIATAAIVSGHQRTKCPLNNSKVRFQSPYMKDPFYSGVSRPLRRPGGGKCAPSSCIGSRQSN